MTLEPITAEFSGETKELKIGEVMPDGTIYAGISPDTGAAMFTAAENAPLTYQFRGAQEYAKKLSAHGHQDWRVPTKGELNELFKNRAAIGGFVETINTGPVRYWSSSQPMTYRRWAQRFNDGRQFDFEELEYSSLRCVR